MIKLDSKYLFKIIILIGAYAITGLAGLQFDALGGFATFVWPPAGIALAALLIWGYELWPGIFIGALIVNRLTGAPLLVSVGMAIGNTLEAYVAYYLLSHSKGFKGSLENLRDIFRFLVFGISLSTLIAASIGVMSLLFGHVIDAPSFGKTWVAWWVGDMLGIQLVGSLLLVWFSNKMNFKPDRRINAKKIIEAVCLFLLVFILGLFVFGFLKGGAYPITYIIFIPVIWGAVGFGQRGVVIVSAALSAISIWGTTAGYGPFMVGSLAESLFYLQIFMGTLSGVGMILAGVVLERREKETLLMELNQQLEERVEKRTFELKRAQEIIERSFEGIMIANGTQQHLIQYVNPAWEKLTGWKSEEVVNKESPRILKSGKSSGEFYKKLWDTILAGKLFSAQLTNKRKDGTFYEAEISIIPITSNEGVHYYAEVSRDVTEHKKMEAQLAEYTKGLEFVVAERTKELEEKVNDLEKLNKFMVGRELKMIELKERNKDLAGTVLKSQSSKTPKKRTKK